MRLAIDFGHNHLDLEVRDEGLLSVQQEPPAPPLSDPAGAVRHALEKPFDFPALRRALTPDDHVVVVVDPDLPRLPDILPPVLEHISQARVAASAITLLSPPASEMPPWRDLLPEQFQPVQIQKHDPTDRKQLSYLATTKHGRRLYLSRAAVDADQLVVLARSAYDPLLGYGGAEGAIYPTLADEATRQEMCDKLSLSAPGKAPWPVRREAIEVAWLLGAPFLMQVVPGAGDDIVHVVAGMAKTASESQRLLDARWRRAVSQPADTVIASIAGPGQRSFADLARALACAARVVKPHGRIVLLSDAGPVLGVGGELLRQAESPESALELLKKQKPPDMAAAFQWASSVRRASVYLLSGLPQETAEELFTTPLDHAGQVQRLVGGDGSLLYLPEADKALVVADK